MHCASCNAHALLIGILINDNLGTSIWYDYRKGSSILSWVQTKKMKAIECAPSRFI